MFFTENEVLSCKNVVFKILMNLAAKKTWSVSVTSTLQSSDISRVKDSSWMLPPKGDEANPTELF